MSTLGEHTGNGNSPATSQQQEDTQEHSYGILQHFDVVPSRFDRVIFRYYYVLVLGTFFLDELLLLPDLFPRGLSSFQVGVFLVGNGLDLFPVVAGILVTWRFGVWRARTPKTLHDLLEKKRIDLPDGDTNTAYGRFLQDYRDALASPKRYLVSGSLMLLVSFIYAYDIYLITVEPLHNVVTLLRYGGENLFGALGAMVIAYCIGIGIWAMYVSGCYVRKLVHCG